MIRFSEEQEVEGSEGYVKKKKWVGHGDGHVDGSPGKKAEVGGDGGGRGGVDGEERASSGHIGSNWTRVPWQQAGSWVQVQAMAQS